MKKLINAPDAVVREMLEGMCIANPDIVYFPDFEVIARKNLDQKVGLVSGGGSGHEPAHAGYVGRGMLDSAVAGNVFASPSPDRIIKAIDHADTGRGVLLIIKNYSGDIMNFSMAQEIAEAQGIKVRSVIVKDDVAVPDSTYSTGRRGIAGTVFVHKVAGAKAQAGGSLDEVYDVAAKAIDNVRSMGMAMTSCVLPAVGRPGFELKEDEIEIGMGIHGEPGIEKTSVKSARETAVILCEKILADKDYKGAEAAVMVNGLGATPLMELFIIAREVDVILKANGVRPYRYFTGNFMTSLEMAGASVSVLKLDEELKALLDARCDAPSMRVGC